MPFQLNIRHNVEAAGEDPFTAGLVRAFESGVAVRVGAGPDCECRVPEPEFEPEHFVLTDEAETGTAQVRPCPHAESFLNGAPVLESALVRNGDEIRVGHWTFRFQRLYPPVRRASRASLLAVFTKTLAGLILMAELGVAFWLPQRVRAIERVGERSLRQEAVWLIDQQLRPRNRAALRDLTEEGLALRAPERLERDARLLLQDELDALVRYLRANEETLRPQQWQRIHAELCRIAAAMEKVEAGTVFRPLPRLDVEAAVGAVLTHRGQGRSDNHDE